jgi:predicted nucleotide-binding protein
VKERFEGEDGQVRLFRALNSQQLCLGNDEVISTVAKVGTIHEVGSGEVLIRQGGCDTDYFFILIGHFDVIVNGSKVNERGPGVHVGEVSGMDAGQKRSATLVATEASIVLKVSDCEIGKLVEKYPKMAEVMAVIANKRLLERNALVAPCNDRPHILIVSSTEALPVAREIQTQFRDDDYVVRVWDQGVFTLSGYPIPALERAFDEVDFAIVVAQPDDVTTSRGNEKTVPRDNVTFEMGLATGKLGLDRTIILQPSDRKTSLASDTAGLTTARYSSADALKIALGPSCNDIRNHIHGLGVRRVRNAVAAYK